MSGKSRSARELVAEALTHFNMVLLYSEEGEWSQLIVDAISMRLSAGIEVLSKLEPDDRERLFGDEWQMMWGMRNRIAHGYSLADTRLITTTAKKDIPPLVETLRDFMNGNEA